MSAVIAMVWKWLGPKVLGSIVPILISAFLTGAVSETFSSIKWNWRMRRATSAARKEGYEKGIALCREKCGDCEPEQRRWWWTWRRRSESEVNETYESNRNVIDALADMEGLSMDDAVHLWLEQQEAEEIEPAWFEWTDKLNLRKDGDGS